MKIQQPQGAKTYALPTERNEPSDLLSDYSILLFGAKKIGKTSLAARFPDAIFLAAEPGTKALRVFSIPINNWDDFNGNLKELENGKHKFKNVVVDTIDLIYGYAFEKICKSKGVKHPSEMEDYGATWGEIKTLFKSGVLRVLRLRNMGCVLISHDCEKEVENREGEKFDRIQPTMDKQAMGVVEAYVDLIISYQYNKEARWMRLRGAEDHVAGCRIEEHFLRKGGKPRVPGDAINYIPCGSSAQEAYDNLTNAFNNKQELIDPREKPKTKFILRK